MAWVLLIVAGLLEVGWAAALPATAGLSRLWPTAALLALLSASMRWTCRFSVSRSWLSGSARPGAYTTGLVGGRWSVVGGR